MNIKRILTAFVCCMACAVPFSANASGSYGKAYLIGEIGSESNWTVTDDAVKIDGDAKYEYTWNTSGDIEYLALCITPDGGYTNFNSITFPNLDIAVEEIWIDGEKIEDYEMSLNSVDMNYFSDGAGITRVYIKNGNTPADINDIDSNDSISKSIRVVFNVSGLGADGTSNYVPDEQPQTTAITEKTKTVTTVATTTHSTAISVISTLTAVPDIDKSAPTGDKGIGFAILALELSSLTLMMSGLGKKKK